MQGKETTFMKHISGFSAVSLRTGTYNIIIIQKTKLCTKRYNVN